MTLLQEQEFHELYQSQIQAATLISHSILVIQSYKYKLINTYTDNSGTTTT